MNVLFVAAIIVVFGGAVWALTRKKNTSNGSDGTFGGGSSMPEDPKGPVEPM